MSLQETEDKYCSNASEISADNPTKVTLLCTLMSFLQEKALSERTTVVSEGISTHGMDSTHRLSSITRSG